MVRAAPHYLLFTETFVNPEKDLGHWRFTLQEVNGPDRQEVVDHEPGVCGERLELLSVVRGLEALDQPSSVMVVTASRYVTRGFRLGLTQWRDNDWCWERFGQMEKITNFDLWKRIHRAMQFHIVQCRCWKSDQNMKALEQHKQELVELKNRDNAQATAAFKQLTRWSGLTVARWAQRTRYWALKLAGNAPRASMAVSRQA